MKAKIIYVLLLCLSIFLLIINELLVFLWRNKELTSLKPNSIDCFYIIFILTIIMVSGAVIYLLLPIPNKKKREKVACFVLMVILLFTMHNSYFASMRFSYKGNITRCQYGMRNLVGLFSGYYFYNHSYPDPNIWCDELSAMIKNDGTNYSEQSFLYFKCPAVGTGRCNYAVNPNVNTSSPEGIVWIFESYDDWNLNGGRELMNTENHGGQGCNVMFYKRGIEFVETDKLDDLNWGKK